MTPLRRLAAVLLGIALATSASGGESAGASAASAARAFYEAYARGDEGTVVSMWAEAAPAELRRRTGWTMRTRCRRLLTIDVTALDANGDAATVAVHALLTRRPRAGDDALEPHDARLVLTRAAGRWRVAKWTLREETLADAIVAAPSDAARDALIDAEPDAVTPLLGRLVAQRALDACNRRESALAASLSRAMKRTADAIGDRAAASLAYGIDSILLRNAGGAENLHAAVEAGRTSLAQAEQSGDPDALAKALLRFARAQDAEYLGTSGGEPYQRILDMADDLEDALPLGTAASRLAAFHADRADHRRALYYGVLARTIARENGDSLTLGSADVNLGMEYQFDGDYDMADERLREALAAWRSGGFRAGELSVLVGLATNAHFRADMTEFRRLAAEIRHLVQPADNAAILTELSIQEALFEIERKEFKDAEEAARTAIRLAPPSDLYRARLTLARVRLAAHQPAEALAEIARARKDDPASEALPTNIASAAALRQLGRLTEATSTLKRALEQLEYERGTIVADDRQRRLFLKERLSAYVDLVDLLVAQGQNDEALSIADETKGRALLDILSGTEARLPTMSDQERRTELALAARVSARHATPGNAARAELERSRRELDAFRAQMRAKYPSPAAAVTSAALTPAELNALLPDSKTAFLEYVLTDTRLHIFVVRRGAARPDIRRRTVTIARTRLEAEATRFRDALAAGDLRYESSARALYAHLLAAVEPDLHGVTTLCIVPDGALWHVPFEALLGPSGTFVAARFATSYVPSIAVYSVMQRTRPARAKGARSLLAFANPPVPRRLGAERSAIGDTELAPLPDAEREVAAVAAFCSRRTVYVGRDALETRAKQESNRYDVIHFATHGIIDDVNPMYSHLLLTGGGGDDGLLETWELMRLDLRADLVVLSACDTARGQVGAGEGLIGMAWALFAAGSPSTIATQWKVESATAADLMIAFYREWNRAPAGSGAFAKAVALQRARAAIRKDPQRRHPFFWASHVLIGLGD